MFATKKGLDGPSVSNHSDYRGLRDTLLKPIFRLNRLSISGIIYVKFAIPKGFAIP